MRPGSTIELGQQRVPFGYEGVLSASKLDTLERALYMSDRGRAGGYGDVRDLGVIARGQLAHGVVEYTGGVFNGLGESMNEVDRNGQKAFAGRIVVHPAIRGLQFGGSIARGAFQSTDATRRDRAGVELLFARGLVQLQVGAGVGPRRSGVAPRLLRAGDGPAASDAADGAARRRLGSRHAERSDRRHGRGTRLGRRA